jgi:hypothetical protein
LSCERGLVFVDGLVLEFIDGWLVGDIGGLVSTR